VFMNILVNAIDAIEESLVKNQGQIRIRTEFTDEKQVIIQIYDNGIGMSEEVKQRVFDYMFTTKPVGKGIGLGMAIAYQIVVDKHAGSIEVDSIPKSGTEFTIRIPLKSKKS
jgi:two-component system NtrC family sensor kinase